MKLFGYFRSSAAYRVRIALNLKGMPVETVSIHLRKGVQTSEEYRAVNPQGLVPTLEHGSNLIGQSLAIIEYLEELKPQPALLPAAPVNRAYVRSIAMAAACDIHPLNNLRVLNHLEGTLGLSAERRQQWYEHWVAAGFTGLEQLLRSDPRVGRFCLGDEPGLAEVCLVPQVYNAERFKCDLSPYPTLRRIVEEARQLPSFADAVPERQPDAE